MLSKLFDRWPFRILLWILLFLGLPLGLLGELVLDWYRGDETERGSPDAEVGATTGRIFIAGIITLVVIVGVAGYLVLR